VDVPIAQSIVKGHFVAWCVVPSLKGGSAYGRESSAAASPAMLGEVSANSFATPSRILVESNAEMTKPSPVCLPSHRFDIGAPVEKTIRSARIFARWLPCTF